MFEQELYEKEAAELKTEPGDLFHNYEIKNWELNARIYKIIAVSAVVNVLAFFALGQPRLFTRGACESPFVGRICSVLDTVYVGSVLFGTEREYVDKEYTKTELGDAEEITWIDQTGIEPQFTYPEGYFYQDPALVAQNEFSQPGFLAPGIPSNPTTSSPLIDTPQVLPRANPNAVGGKEGDLFSVGEDDENTTAANKVNRKGSRGGGLTGPGNVNANTQVANANTNTNPTVTPTGPVPGVTINREPMRKFGQGVAVKLDNGEVDLSKNFKVTAEVALTEDGKIDTTVDSKTNRPKSRTLTAEGDQELVKVVSEAIAAIGDSGWLGYLKIAGVDKVKFEFAQDDTRLYAVITSDQPSANNAKKVFKGLEGLIQGALLFDSTNVKKLGDDEKIMLEAAKVSFKGRQVILNFEFPKAVAQEIINRNIQKARDAATGQAPNSKIEPPKSNSSIAVK